MPATVTFFAEMTLAGDLGNVASYGNNSVDAVVEAALDGDHKTGTQDVTTSAAAIDTGTVDVTKMHGVFIVNQTPAGATNVIKVMSYDGTNSIEVGRLVAGGIGRFVTTLPPQSSGFPKLRLITDSGAAKAAVKVFELGTPGT